MSPSMRGASPGLRAPSGCKAGNDSTLVGLSMPRQLQFNVRMPGSSASITASSVSPTSASTEPAAAAIARRITTSASGSFRQQSATTRTSVMGRVSCDIVQGKLFRRAQPAGMTLYHLISLDGRLLRQSFVGRDDARHQFVADHVLGSKPDLGDAFDPVEQLCRFREARG